MYGKIFNFGYICNILMLFGKIGIKKDFFQNFGKVGNRNNFEIEQETRGVSLALS